MQVFVSSTVYDLIDIRAEVAEHLRGMGIAPLLSDDSGSDFKVLSTANSIESCLVNVERADDVIVILDQRYGPSLGSDFGGVSATHLEYLHAKKHGKPIHVFVRNRLEADYAIWKKNNKQDNLELSWVSNEKDRSLFGLLDDHKKLAKKTKTSNWYTTFSDSVDLKKAITKRFEKRILPARLTEAIAANQFPMFEVEISTSKPNNGKLILSIDIINISQKTAFNFKCWFDDAEKAGPVDIFTIGMKHSLQVCFDLHAHEKEDCFTKVCFSYVSAIGIEVTETYQIGLVCVPEGYVPRREKIDQIFRYTKPIELEIHDS